MGTKRTRQKKKPVCELISRVGEQTGHACTGPLKRLLGESILGNKMDNNAFSN